MKFNISFATLLDRLTKKGEILMTRGELKDLQIALQKAKKEFETGRSMVEMLGVLAVIGVLSVAGIAGYTSAMNRYRANELLNEASKRASVISGQINMFGYTPSLAEFTTNAWGYGAFENTVYGADGTAAWTKTDKQFTLSLTGISEGVCQHMQQVVSLPIKGFQPETCAEGDANIVKLTYNNDMSREDIAPQPCTSANDSKACCQELGSGNWTGTACGACTSKQDSKYCCTVVDTGWWFDDQSLCCYSPYDSPACCSKFASGVWDYEADTCCAHPNDSRMCCTALGSGVWVGDEGCCSSPVETYECCRRYTNSQDAFILGSTCCSSIQDSEACCTSKNGTWIGTECCPDSGYSAACCTALGSGVFVDGAGHCCSSYAEADTCCQIYLNNENAWQISNTTCCSSIQDSEECCTSKNGAWTGTECVL